MCRMSNEDSTERVVVDIAQQIRLCGDGGYNIEAADEIERLRNELAVTSIALRETERLLRNCMDSLRETAGR